MAKRHKLDAIYISRFQVEKWTDEELERNINIPAAKRELEKRKERQKRND